MPLNNLAVTVIMLGKCSCPVLQSVIVFTLNVSIASLCPAYPHALETSSRVLGLDESSTLGSPSFAFTIKFSPLRVASPNVRQMSFTSLVMLWVLSAYEVCVGFVVN